MSIVYDDVMTKCPYYFGSAKYSIRCEGIINDTETVTKFDDVAQKQEYQKRECFRYPNECPIAIEHDGRAGQHN